MAPVLSRVSLRFGFGDSARGGASLGRVLLMASLRFGQSKEHVPADGTRAVKGIFALQLMAPVLGMFFC
jgi:hypothetical protein